MASPSGYELKGEFSSRIAAPNSRLKQEYDRRLLTYEKEFDVGISRMRGRDKGLNDSMLAYTEKMRRITNARMNPEKDFLAQEVPLVIRAKHIPKFPVPKTNRRRPASLDELIGKPQNKRDKPKSASRLSLPTLPEKYGKGSHRVKISFVSASDLYDIVDFSIRSKANKEETLKYLRMESLGKPSQRSPGLPDRPSAALPREAFANKHDADGSGEESDPRLTALPPIIDKNVCVPGGDGNSVDDIDEELKNTTELGKLAQDALKRRPNRARRMQLNKPDLLSIPEDDIASLRRSGKSERTLPSPPLKHSPRNVMNMQSQLVSIPENDLSNNTDLQISEKKKISKLQRKDNSQSVTAMVKLEPFSHMEKEKQSDSGDSDPHLKVKMKAQKRFRRLIFLRDVPDRKNRV